MKSSKMIKLKNIYKSYSASIVLDNVSLEILPNSVTGIIGPNGAGKSTLLKIIAGFLSYEKGEIKFFDKPIRSFASIKDKISYMPEKMQLYPNYFVGEYLKFFHKIAGYKNQMLFDNLSIKEILNKKIKNLSKGWHQRLKLYLTLNNNKPIVILDEPFDGFDPLQMLLIIDILRKFENKTFIISIHQLSYAQKICDNFVLLDKGKIIEHGTFGELKTRYGQTDIEEIFIKALKK